MSNIISSGNELLKFNSGEVIEVSERFPIPIPTMWLRADAGIVKDAIDKVSQWQDQSGNDYHAEQETQANKPLLVDGAVTGNPVLRFAGSQFMTLQFGEIYPQPITIFTVWSLDTTGNRMAWDNYSGGRFYLYRMASNEQMWINAENVSLSYPKADGSFPHLLSTSVFNGQFSQMYENGNIKATGNASTGGCNGLNIGRYKLNSLFLSGDIAEIIFYNSLLSDPQRQSVEQYLMAKYAL